MPQISAVENPTLAKQAIERLEAEERKHRQSKEDVPPPDAIPPSEGIFRLPGGYLPVGGSALEKEIEVRELTGRDEEYLFKFREQPGRFFTAILECGVVRIGSEPGSLELLDSMLAGDWEAALIFVRIATFGKTIEFSQTCSACGTEYRSIIDLTMLPMKELDDVEDLQFVVTGRHGTRYRLNHAYGETQRKILSKVESPVAEMNSLLIGDCLVSVDDIPSLGRDTVLDIPMADRRMLLKAIDERRVGPRLTEVTTECPTCENERPAGLGIAAMFQ